MARCASEGCQRWCPDIFARRGAGTSIDGHWFCSAHCVEQMARRRLMAARPLATGIPAVPPLRLGVLLRHAAGVSAHDITCAVALQRQSRLKLGAQLRAMGAVSGDDVVRGLAAQAGISYITALDPVCVRDAPGGLSPHAVRALGVVPFNPPEHGRIRVAVAAPVPRVAFGALRQLTGWTPEPYLVDDDNWAALMNAYGAGVPGKALPGPLVEFVQAHSLSDAAARIAAAATSGGRTRVTEAHWDPYTWVRVQGEGVIRDVLLSREPDKERPCPAGNTSH
jgi:hypothetical protein